MTGDEAQAASRAATASMVLAALQAAGGGGRGILPFPNDPLALAGGGIVTRPTFALIGEAGPEAIIPLGRGGGVGSTIVVNVNIAGSVVSEHELDTRIHKTVNRRAQRGGHSVMPQIPRTI